MAHLLIAAAHKSSGKTTVSVGLAAALRRRGVSVQPFKKGPDYIDPMWLSEAAGRPCFNLDFNSQSRAEILATFAAHAAGADLGLIEGNMGLYDGLDIKGGDSNAALAKLLGAPVVLVLDARGMTRGIAPLVLGYRAFDAELAIKGVILNKLAGARQEGKLRAVLERYTDVPVLGAIGRDDALMVAERHLGLVTPGETARMAAVIDRLAEAVAAGVDIERLRQVARAGRLPASARDDAPARCRGRRLRLAIARDEAFGFYYQDDLDALSAAGAELVPFDTLRDAHLPACDGLFLGGGFPETHMAALEANASLRGEIRSALAAGLPAYAECGGLMYLCRGLSWRGQRREMVGAVPAEAVMHERPQGRGYVRLEETGNGPWPLKAAGGAGPARFPAHEFHYAGLEGLPSDTVFAYRVLRGTGIDGRHDGIVLGNLVAGFAHLRDVAGNRWAARFVDFIAARGRRAGRSAAAAARPASGASRPAP